MPSFIAKCRDTPWLVFALVLAWRLGLLLVSAQPVPANDSFFYDGAVVNKLLHGHYFNPSLALALPISGTRVFSAYPPLYQGALWLWMSVFGTSVVAAIALHLVLLAAYAVVVYRIIKRLGLPAWCFHLTGAFLLVITFTDRPDSLAHLLGMLAVYYWIGSRRVFDANATQPPHSTRALSLMVVFLILTLSTSLQIGLVYLALIWLGMTFTSLSGHERFPFGAMAATVVVPAVLVAAVRVLRPEWWAGFLEHARQTPSLTGWRAPELGDILKIIRTVPAVCLLIPMLPLAWVKQYNNVDHAKYARFEFALIPLFLAALAVVVAALFVLTPNTIAIAAYLQPLIVAAYLGFSLALFAGQRWMRFQILCLCLAAALGSIRAVGTSTWGLACASDVGYSAAIRDVNTELAAQPTGSMVIVSSAYLYDASNRSNLTLIHSDWMHPAKASPPVTDLQALISLKPRAIILTQFDYYRRYQVTLAEAKTNRELAEIKITDTAKIRPPDAYPSFQRVLQQISWAPIIVDLSWRDPSAN